MNGTEVGLIIGGVGATAAAIGALIYTSPGRAWQLLVQSLNERVTVLERERVQNREELRGVESEVRRLRTIRSILEDVIRKLGGDVPMFAAGEHPEIAPERRAPIVVEDLPDA